jgi:molybdopterin molybdotransferase
VLSVDAARARVMEGVLPLAAEIVSLETACGRVLAQSIAARTTQPPKDVSAMDGYAVRAVDCLAPPVRLTLIGTAAAGHAFLGSVGPKQAVRIFTGAPLPGGADAIVIQEDAEAEDGAVVIRQAAVIGRWIRRCGADWREGDRALAVGHVLSARDIGVVAAMNHAWLRVRRRARVGIIATGDEILLPGEPAGSATIFGGNAFMIAACVRAWGGEPIHLGIAPDDPAPLDHLLRATRGLDLIVTIGGASVGDRDLVKAALGRRGFDLAFHKVAMRPGKPLIAGRLDGVPLLGLPGNPVSSGVTALIFLKPLLDRLHGRETEGPPLRQARLAVPLPANDERQDYLRAQLSRDGDDRLVARPFDRQDSALSLLFATADGLVVRPPFAPPAEAGEAVAVIPFAEAAPGF